MGERIMYFIAFLGCLKIGSETLLTKTAYGGHAIMDFSSLGYYYLLPGTLSICFGFALLYLALRKTPKNYHSTDCVMKCKQCRRAFNYEDTNNGKCPICNIDMIDIETFYENKQFFNIHKNSKRKRHKKKKKPINTTKLNKK
ncbi:MAG: hypothetical protein CR967_04215 [Proteobacteria bacterium]|nr:MAG: hypothetical protein CR967_04215 [Pseudomonadota bacterium]